MSITHVALGDPEGPAHAGDQLDCADCRSALLKAFREPARPPVPSGAPEPSTPPLPPVEHRLSAVAATNPDGTPGGVWSVECSCGWSKSGTFSRRAALPVAERLAQIWAVRHLDLPESTDEEN